MRSIGAFWKGARKGIGRSQWLRFAAVVVIIALGVWLGHIASGNEVVRLIVHRYGYFGVFVVSLVSGFNIFVPVPSVAFIPLFLAAGMGFWPMVLVMVAGETIADMLSFALGRTGREIDDVKHTKVVRRLEKIRKKHYWAPLGVMLVFASAAPFPNEVLAIPLGIMGYPIVHVAVPVLLGNLVFTTAVAFGMQAVLSHL